MTELSDAVATIEESGKNWDSPPPFWPVLFAIAISLLIFFVDLAIDLPEKVEKPLRWSVERSNEWLSQPLAPHWPPPELSLWAIAWFVIVTLAVLLVALLVAVVYLWKWNAARVAAVTAFAHLQASSDTVDQLRKEILSLHAAIAAAPNDYFRAFRGKLDAIWNSDLVRRPVEVLKHDTTYRVNEKGDVLATVRRKIRAKNAGIALLPGGAVSPTRAVKEFGEIDLKVRTHTNDRIMNWLPVSNDPNAKNFLMFVGPTELAAGEELDYEYSFEWPEGMKDLVVTGKDNLRQKLRSLSEIPLITFTLEFHKAIPALLIENMGYGGGKLDDKGPDVIANYRTYVWKLQNLTPSADREIVLSLRPM